MRFLLAAAVALQASAGEALPLLGKPCLCWHSRHQALKAPHHWVVAVAEYTVMRL